MSQVWIDGHELEELVLNTYDALKACKRVRKSIDMLPYSADFNRVYSRVISVIPCGKDEVWHILIRKRKSPENDPRTWAPGGRKEKAMKAS